LINSSHFLHPCGASLDILLKYSKDACYCHISIMIIFWTIIMNPFSYFASKHLTIFQLKQNFHHQTIHSRYSLIKFLKIYWCDFDVLAFGLQDFQIGLKNFLCCIKKHICDILNHLQNITKIYFLCELTLNCKLFWIFF
jgi:hypothetical protein